MIWKYIVSIIEIYTNKESKIYMREPQLKISPYSKLFSSTFFPDFPAFWLNTERYPECGKIRENPGKMRTRTTPNTDSFYAVSSIVNDFEIKCCLVEHIHIFFSHDKIHRQCRASLLSSLLQAWFPLTYLLGRSIIFLGGRLTFFLMHDFYSLEIDQSFLVDII